MAVTKGITAFYPSYQNGISAFDLTFPTPWSTAGKAVLTITAPATPVISGLGSFTLHVWYAGTYSTLSPDSGTNNQFTINKTTGPNIACVLTIQVVQSAILPANTGVSATYGNGAITESPSGSGTGGSIACSVTNFQAGTNSSGISVSVVLSGGGGM